MIYVCPHYADPFTEFIFETREEAEAYADAFQRVTKTEIKIEEREE